MADVETTVLTETEAAAQLNLLAEDYFVLRAATSQPMSADDVPRCERPAGWAPDFSKQALEQRLADYAEYSQKMRAILRASEPQDWPRAQQVDAAVVMAHLERLRWEQTVLRPFRRNPDFFIAQTLGAVQETLVGAELIESAADRRLSELLVRLEAVPTVLTQAEGHLSTGEAESEFATIALSNLEGRESCCRRVVEAIDDSLIQGQSRAWAEKDAFLGAADAADAAVEQFRRWLQQAQPAMRTGQAAVGREGFEDFLSNVALVEWFGIDDMLQLGDAELRRSQAMTTIEENRNRAVPLRPQMHSIEEQEQEIAAREAQIRSFVEDKA